MQAATDIRGSTRNAGRPVPPATAELDELIPAYHFIEYLDSGGMGAVYKAVQKSLNRTVAVKVLPSLHLEKEGFAERFKREAQALAVLNHPHIISVYDFGETSDGQLYYAMEFVSGMDLQQLMKRDPPGPRKIMQIITQVCDALQYAHDRGIVHRDIKPANILLDERGNVKVADFGLAKIVGPQAVDYTATGTTLGTPDYIAPEAMEYGVKIDHRVDIYSLGVMIYELLTGYVPKGQWEPPSIRSGADKRVDALVSRAMQNDPDKRYQNVSDMTQVLQKLMKSCDNWKHFRRPTKISTILPPPKPAAAVDQNADTLPLPQRAAGMAGRPRTMTRAAVSTLLLAAGGLLVAWQGGWWPMPASGPAAATLLTNGPETSPRDDQGGTPPAAPAGSVAQETGPTATQEKLLRWVFEKHAFVNVITASNTAKAKGDAADIYRFEDLPTEPFTIWRVCFGDFGAKVSDETTLEEMASLLNELGTVSNVGLRGLDVPAPALRHLAEIRNLANLDLSESPVLNDEAVPYLTACKELKLLRVGSPTHPRDEAIVQQLHDGLPDCKIMNN